MPPGSRKATATTALILAAGLAPLAGCGSLKQIGAGEQNPPPKSFTIGGRVTTVIINGGGGSIAITGSPGRRAIAVSQQASYSVKPPTTAHSVHGSTLTLSYTCPAQLICGVSYVLRVAPR